MRIDTSDLALQRPTWAEINLNQLNSNFDYIRKMVNPAGILAVVKADGYGHGAVAIARELSLAGAERFGTATIQEAIELRKAGIKSPVVVLSGMQIPQLPLLLQYDVTPSVYDFEFLNALDEFTQRHRKKVFIHIKVDTGMGRLGFSIEEVAAVFKRNFVFLEIEGIYTHFANADVPEDDYTERQLQKFLELLSRENVSVRFRHAANSAGILNFPQAHLDLVRPGFILYGMSPSPRNIIPQQPILSIKSRVIALRAIAKGETIGYGRTFRAMTDSLIATVPFGYADGLRRDLSNRLDVEVCGRMCRIAGTISMDLCMIDVTNVATNIKIGDEVTFLGPRTTAWDWANLLNTIPYEITCLIGARVPRVYVKDGSICEVYYP